jgi:hypothetical protein
VENSNTTRLLPVFGRLLWMMIGPLALVLTIYSIATSGAGWTTTADILYFIILGGMMLGRWLEFHGGRPETSTGEPATDADLRRYVLTIMAAGPIVWVLANLVGNYLLAK